MNRPPDLMFPFVGGKRRMKGICFTLLAAAVVLYAMIGAVMASPVVLLPALAFGIPFLIVGIESLRSSVLLVREIDVLVAWSTRAHKQWLLQGVSHAQATAERLRLTYIADPALPLDLTLEATDFPPSSWWPLVSTVLERARRLNPVMAVTLSDELASLPALTADDLRTFQAPPWS